MANKPLKSIKFPGLSDTYTVPQVDSTLAVAGAAADAKAVGDAIEAIVPGLSDNAKIALLNCFAHVAWVDVHGQDYYDALRATLYGTPVSISAVFTQGSAKIYLNDELDVLKQYLVVTATYADQTTAVITDYELTGTLTAGTSVITVEYGGKTDTFNVTVSNGYRVDGSKLRIAGNARTDPYYDTTRNNRLSYSGFDLLLAGGKSYRIEMDSDVTTANFGIQGYNQRVLTAVSNRQEFQTTDIYDPGWQSLPATLSLPATVNGFPFAGLRFTLRKNSNDDPIGTNFVEEIRITEVS